MEDVWKNRIRIAMVVLPIVVGLYIIWTVRTAILPFVLGTAIAYVIAPAVTWLATRLPFYNAKPYAARGVAILLLYASFAAAAVGIGFLVVPDAIDEINEFSDTLPDTIDRVRERIQEWYDEYVPEEHHARVDGWLEDAGNSAGDWAVGLAPRAAGFIGSTFAILIGYLTIPVWLFYTLKDHPRGVRSFIGMFPPSWRHDVRNVIGIVDAVFKNYIRAMLLQGLLVGVMSYIALEMLDVNYPIGLAIIAGITEMIPIIGPIIGAIPAVLVALAQDPVKAIWVALAFLVIQQIENNFIVPKIQGDFLRLHPGVIIVLLVLAGSLGGFIFVILAIPLAAMVRDMYQYAYLRLGDVEPDPALDRAIGEYGAKALRLRLSLEEVAPTEELGESAFGNAPVPPPPPDLPPGDDPAESAGSTDAEGTQDGNAPTKRRLRFVPGRKN
jgi:predicted PurR-regulated permease PerM